MRRIIAAVAALVVSLTMASAAQAEVTPITKPGWTRWSGEDRFATAVEVSKATFTPGVGAVYVVSGEDFPDALAAGPVAGANQSPVLLTKKGSVPAVVADELARLKPSDVIVVGGTSVITDATMAELAEAAGAEAVRFAGDDRYLTALRLTQALEGPPVYYLASGESFADALAAGAAAGKEHGALLLTAKSKLPAAVADYIKIAEAQKIVIVGGTSAVSAAVETSIKSLAPKTEVVRHAGADRFDTAALVALDAWPDITDTILYAPGADYPDALGATPAAIVNDAPMLLTTPTCHPFETLVATEELDPLSLVAVGGAKVTHAGETICGPAPTPPWDRDVNCKDFPTQKAAQRWFDYWYARVGDVMGLDRDKDGKVCEVWPPR